MTHERLTPNDEVNYSIHRMPETGDTKEAGPKPSIRTPEQMEANRQYWNKKIAQATDPNERQALRTLREMGIPQIEGGAPDINLDGITSLKVRDLGNQANEFLSAAGETTENLIEVRRNIMTAPVPPEEESQKRILLQRIIERITERKERDERERLETETKRMSHSREVQIVGFLDRLDEIFAKETVRNELIKDAADFSGEALKEIVDIIKGEVNPTDPKFITLAQFIAGLRTDNLEDAEGQTHLKQASKNSKELMFEWLVERIIGIPDKGSPDQRYSIGGFQMQSVLDDLKNLSQKFDQEFTRYIQELIHVREISHELNRSFSSGELYKKFIAEELRASGLDFMQNKVVGVGSVIRLYEKVTSQKVAEKKRWLLPEDIHNIDAEVEKLFEDLCEESAVTKGGRKLTDWERARSLRLAKILFSGTQRLAMYAVLGEVPTDWTERLASIPLEFVARNLVSLKLIGERYFGHGDPGQRRFVELIGEALGDTGTYSLDRNMEDPHRSKRGLFGLNEKTTMFNHSGVYDPESHSWRMPLLFLSNIDILQENGIKTNLKDYIAGRITDPAYRDAKGKIKNKDFSKEVEDFVLGQTLYLSVLQKYGDFDDDLKTKIWKKIATYKPSTIVALLGGDKVFESQAERELWKGLKSKLFTEEEKRVEEESLKYASPLREEDLRTEAKKFKGNTVRDEFKYQFVRGIEGLTTEERNLLQRIVDKGYENADLFAKATTTYTYAIDDVARISWSRSEGGERGSGPEDLLRIFNDQNRLGEAWDQVNGLIASPVSDPAEHFKKFVEAYQSVHGYQKAQEKIEPFILAYTKFVSTKEWILWTPGAKTLKRFLRQHTSEIEKHYKSSYLSWDEEERSTFLQALAQAKVISDDTDEGKEIKDKNGNILKKYTTHLDYLMNKTKSNRMRRVLRWFRIMLMIFGPVAGYEFLKEIAPDEAKKILG